MKRFIHKVVAYLGRKKLFVKWLISYVVIMMIPLVIISYGYTKLLHIMETQVIEEQMASMGQVKHNLNNDFDEIKMSATFLANNDLNRSVVNARELEARHRYNMIQLRRDINLIALGNDLIKGIYLYYPEHDTVLSQWGTSSLEDFYMNYHKNDRLSYQQWDTMMAETTPSGALVTFTDLNAKGQAVPSIAYVTSLKMGVASKSTAAMVFLLDQQTMKQFLNEHAMGREGVLALLDAKGNIVEYGGQSQGNELEQIGAFAKEKGQESSGKAKYIMNSVALDNDGLSLVSLMPRRIIVQTVMNYKKEQYILVLACLLVGILGSCLLARTRLKPLQAIYHKILKWSDRDLTAYPVSYMNIDNIIDEMLEEDEHIHQRLNKQKSIMLSHMMTKWLKGQITEPDYFNAICDMHSIDFPYSNYYMILLYIDDYTEFYHKLYDKNPEEVHGLANSIIEDQLNKILGREGTQCAMTEKCIEVDGMIACIVNAENADCDYTPYLLSVANELCDYMEEQMKIYVSIAVSHRHAEPEGLITCYHEVLEAMEYKQLVGDQSRVVRYEKESTHTVGHYLDHEMTFIQSIRSHDYKRAEEVMESILHNSLHNCPSRLAKYRIVSMVNLMVHALSELRGDHQALPYDIGTVQQLSSCHSTSKLKALCRKLMMDLKERRAKVESQQTGNYKLVESIANYVMANYTDPDLNISAIAAHLDMSEAYISRTFRDYYGIRLLDYIHSQRIEKAKELLNTSEMKVKEIANSVGYYNSVSFIRIFKKIVNATPSEYKKTCPSTIDNIVYADL